MTEAEVIQVLRQYFASRFPKVCQNCGRRYAHLREYIQGTTRVGRALSYDAELGNWDTQQPLGALILVSCACGTTLALSTQDMPMPQRLALLQWVKTETQRRGVSPSELLEHLREQARRQILEENSLGGSR